MLPAPGSSNITVPNEIVDRIDDFLATNRWGYRSRPEVVVAAVRKFLQEESARAGEPGKDPTRGFPKLQGELREGKLAREKKGEK